MHLSRKLYMLPRLNGCIKRVLLLPDIFYFSSSSILDKWLRDTVFESSLRIF